MQKATRPAPHHKKPHPRILELSHAINLPILDESALLLDPGSLNLPVSDLHIDDPKYKYYSPELNSDVYYLHNGDDSLLAFTFVEIDTHAFKKNPQGFRLQFEGVMYLGCIPSTNWSVRPEFLRAGA